MKRITIAILALSGACANAAPFLTGDVVAEADTCVFTAHGSTTQVESPVVVDNTRGKAEFNFRICRIDLAGSPVGTNNIKLAARNKVWGVTSVEVPFTFAKPGAAIASPGSLAIAP